MESGFARKLDEAWSALSAHHARTPAIGVILGSGLGGLAARAGGAEIPFSSIPGFPSPTVAGHAGILKLGRSVAVMAGRFHYYEGNPIDDVVLPVFLLHRFGVRTLIVTNAAGGHFRFFFLRRWLPPRCRHVRPWSGLGRYAVRAAGLAHGRPGENLRAFDLTNMALDNRLPGPFEK